MVVFIKLNYFGEMGNKGRVISYCMDVSVINLENVCVRGMGIYEFG